MAQGLFRPKGYSTKRRIKTYGFLSLQFLLTAVRKDIPLKEGLRLEAAESINKPLNSPKGYSTKRRIKTTLECSSAL